MTHSDNVGCDEVVRALYEYLDGGGDAQSRENLRQHAQACPSCLEKLGVEQQVREILRTSCCQPAPAELRTRITRQLRVIDQQGSSSYISVTEVSQRWQ